MTKRDERIANRIKEITEKASVKYGGFGEHVGSDIHFLITELEKEISRSAKLVSLVKENKLHYKAPCCLCGYNGGGYFQPDSHKCFAEYNQESGK